MFECMLNIKYLRINYNMSAIASTERTSIFMTLGHGEEDLIDINERNVLPPGYTLVTFAECGNVSYLNTTVNKVVTAFLDPANGDTLSNTRIDNLTTLFGDGTVHIYHSGDRYPKLTCQMFLDWDIPRIGKHAVVKAGLYKFPLTNDKSEYIVQKIIDVVPSSLMSFTATGDDEVKQLYNNAIIPTQEELTTILSNRSNRYLSEFRKRLTYPLEKIFEAGGPGIYYWVICRSITMAKSLEDYRDKITDKIRWGNDVTIDDYESIHIPKETLEEQLKRNAVYRSVATRYNPYIYEWIDRYNSVKPLMDENASNPALPNSMKTKLQKIRNAMNTTIGKIGRTRSRSINLHVAPKKGGSRKIRRVQKQRRTRKSKRHNK